jgi:hypothetical protein
MYRLVEYRDDSSHISGGARSYRKSRHRKSRDQKLPWPEMSSPEVTVPALFSYYSSSTKCTIAHSEKMDPTDDPKYSYDSPDIYILQNGTIIELVTSCLLWRHRWITLYAKPINRLLALEGWFEKPKNR